MPSLTPKLTATPAATPTYNTGMAETLSWIPIEGAGRPLFAQASYLTNASDISLNLNAGDISIDNSGLETLVTETNSKLDTLATYTDGVETLLTQLSSTSRYVPGFSVPPYDEIQFEYVDSTDIFRKVTYKQNSTQVMALSFTYVTEPPTTENAVIQSVKKI